MHKKFKIIAATAVIAVVSVVTAMTTSFAQAAEGRECDDNAIIKCGAYSLTELRDKYVGDVQAVFAHYGVSSAEVKGTSGTIKSGYVTKRGNVIVGGEVVATDAVTVGRVSMSGSTPVTIDGKTYYQRTPAVSFQSDQLEAYVFFDANGAFSGAVIKSCGNPVTGEPESNPTAVCKSLTKQVIARNKFSFEAVAEVKEGAKITGYVFTVKDTSGTTVATKSVDSSATSASSGEITIDKPGDYKAHVVVKTSVGDKTSNVCTVTFTVEEPQKPSVMIYKLVDGAERKLVGVDQEFTYQIRAKNTGNVDLTNVVLRDTAPQGVEFVKASIGTIQNGVWTTTIDLKSGEEKTFTITAKVPNYKADDIDNKACINAPQVNPEQPDKWDGCDKATVYVKPPEVKMIWVCELKTNNIIKIKESDFDAAKHSKDLDKCKNNPKPDMIWVCVLETKEIIEIKRSAYDSTKHSRDLTDCREVVTMVPVCDATTGKIISVKESEAANYKPADDEACKGHILTTKTEVKDLPSTGPAETFVSGLVGSSALGLGVTSYLRSRYAVRNALKK